MDLPTNNCDPGLQLEDLKFINAIFEKIRRHSNDLFWANTVTDELFRYQPFLLSMLMGYKPDLSPSELDEALQLYIAIWEYFKVDPKVKTTAITEARFYHFHDLNVLLFATMDPIELKTTTILLAELFKQFVSRPALLHMETQKRAALMIAVKSRIECFEELRKK